MAKLVVGLFDKFDDARDAIDDLISSGFDRDAISVDAHKDILGGIKAGTALPKSRLIAAEGGVLHGLSRRGIPEDHANAYAEGVRRGGTLVSIITDDASSHRAADILSEHGAVDINRRASQWKEAGWNKYDETAAPYTAAQRKSEMETTTAGMGKPARARTGETVIPEVEEEVRIGKRQVQKGGVHVYTHVTETPVEEKVTLREERAKVERRPVDRPLGAGEEAFKETSFEIRETAEEPVVSKEARVKEEVIVGKEAAERTETIREKVRRTDVEVEQMLDTHEKDFRRHHESTVAGGDYNTYRDAYRYAGTMAQDRRYQDKDWPEIEDSVHRDWEKEHPGTWERFKDSIRYGWERISRRPAGAGRR